MTFSTSLDGTLFDGPTGIVKIHDAVNRTALIEQLRATHAALEKLLVLLECAERDRFVSHLYQSRREYRSACERAGKSGKQIERCVISTFQVGREHRLQGRLPPMGAALAGRELITAFTVRHQTIRKGT